ncbi:MAG: type IX secretion system outer membrane channel protein PorV [Thermonemataceae bacterium]
MNYSNLLCLLVVLSFCTTAAFGQGAPTLVTGQIDNDRRVITTAVPFAILSPDARSAGMGDVGVALSPDANATFWNPARTAFAQKQFGVSLSYTPWLRNLVNDMSISQLSAYYKIDDVQAIDFGMTYFDLGDIQFTDENGGLLEDFRPREFAFRAHYSRKLSDNFSVALGPFLIHSNISGTVDVGANNNQARPGTTGGVDLGGFYNKKDLNVGNLPTDIAFGFSITNLGAQISYSDDNQQDFIPANLRLGGAATFHLDPYNKITVAIDVNKLLVPTPPKFLEDANGQVVIENDEPVIAEGRDPNDLTLLQGVFGSFTDAPDGFSEELQEFIGNFGVEYAYANDAGQDLFMVRAGYATEHAQKGERKYFTVGVGGRYQVFGLDMAYMIPTQRTNPLSETLRFTLSLGLGEDME